MSPISSSPDLIWLCVRNSSCFLRKQPRRGVVLTAEPMNLTQKNSRKYSGLANRRSISIESKRCGTSKAGVQLKIKTSRHANKPSKMTTSVSLTRNVRDTCRAIVNETARKYIREDLRKVRKSFKS
jgi:large subunit ribosomal protein L28e